MIALLALVLGSCTPDKIGPPPVDVELLVPVLADLQVAESLMIEVPAPLRDSMREVYYEAVLDDYQLSKERFDSLLLIVRREPEWVSVVYSGVSDELSKREAESRRETPNIDE